MPDWSKIGKSNVRRSKSHERRVAKLLTEWSGVTFRRRRVEGRDEAVRMVEGVSDVISVEREFSFAVEAKCGVGFSMDALLKNPKSCLFTTWWHQTNYDAQLKTKADGRDCYPMLFFKPNPAHDWVVVSSKAIKILEPKNNVVNNNTLWFPHIVYDHYDGLGPIAGDISHTKNKNIAEVELDPLFMCRWRDFEENVKPDSTFVPQT
tara:strand:+ start:1256 stop:1873 length:618 start_codon:yes stop_codon:yes gene_type:complete